MDSKAHEGVYLLPFREVRIIEHAGRQVDNLGVRAVGLRREAERHPVGRIHRDDIVAGHPVGFLHDIAFTAAAAEKVGVIASGGNEGFPTEAPRAADLNEPVLVPVKEVLLEGLNLFLYCHIV